LIQKIILILTIIVLLHISRIDCCLATESGSSSPDTRTKEIVRINEKIIADNLSQANFFVRNIFLGRIWGDPLNESYTTRVKNTKKKLEDIFLRDKEPVVLKCADKHDRTKIIWENNIIVFITAEDAHNEKVSSLQLAQRWKKKIEKAISIMPSIFIKTKSNYVPLGKQVEIPLKGNFKKVSVSGFNQEIISVTPMGRTLYVKGISLGTSRLLISCEEIEKEIYLTVKEFAGIIPNSVELVVTGKPALKQNIEKYLEWLLQLKTELKPDARLEFTPIPEPTKTKSEKEKAKFKFKDMMPGETFAFRAIIKLSGEKYISLMGESEVLIICKDIPQKEINCLMVSNFPETVIKQGELFSGSLNNGSSVRLLYHHFNSRHSPIRSLLVLLKNNNITPVTVHYMISSVGPSPDEIHAGHVATMNFLKYLELEQGLIMNIPGNSVLCIDKRLMKPAQTVSGLAYINILDGESLQINVSSQNINPEDHDPPQDEIIPYNTKCPPTRGIFPPQITIEKIHRIGNPYTFINIGDEPFQKDIFTGGSLYGNYGVNYNIRLIIENPLEKEKKALITMRPGGGAMRGFFKIDGVLLELPPLGHAQRVVLKEIRIPPGESQTVFIETMPQSGSNYPVSIVVETEQAKPGSPMSFVR